MLYIYFFGPSHSETISASLAVNIELFMFLEKTGLFTKFVDSYFSVCRQKSFLMYNSENWDSKTLLRGLFQILLYFQEKGCFY